MEGNNPNQHDVEGLIIIKPKILTTKKLTTKNLDKL